ncbi:DUF930 domain-containing protein [Rhizobium sp. ZPR3]|uniref:DUF930 domain-containing protein n=2 Tax=unclassified Rhizobium TaxID=2613769 RepID=A0AAU7S9E8_9HYPH
MTDTVDPKLIVTARWRQPLGSQLQPNELRRVVAISFVVHLSILVPLTLVRSAQSFREEPEAVAVTLVEPRAGPVSSSERPSQPPRTGSRMQAPAPKTEKGELTHEESKVVEKRADALPPEMHKGENFPGGMIEAHRLRASEVLADPRSAAASKAMKTLAPSARIEQLCNLESMEQVALWKPDLKPDFVVAYAMADTKLEALHIEADGAAVRIANRWYNMRYQCTVSPDLESVKTFEFQMGVEIPKKDWEKHYLTTSDGEQE